jgi:adenosylcobinamide kinase/adenosylcobinamide-phosphate guanylyltransferase
VGKKIIFITGGARSGKSDFALREALKIRGKRAFIATAEAADGEMEDRIRKHKKERGRGWDTHEEPLKIAKLLKRLDRDQSVVVLDCLTLWLANVMMSSPAPVADDEIEALIAALSALKKAWVFIVSNEVGMGIVPENELARRYRDLAGRLNQKVAAVADEVFVTLSGMPLKLKG